MKSYITNGTCPKCGKQLYTSDVESYTFVCHECDENYYGIEVKKILGDWFEVSIVMTSNMFESNLDKIKKAFKDACFIGFDETCREYGCGLCDIGFENIPSAERMHELNMFFIDEIPLGTEPEYIDGTYKIDDGKDGEKSIEETVKYLRKYWNLSGGIDGEEI